MLKLPDSPGVYFFLGPKKDVLYVGKATSLRSRVRSYFHEKVGEKRGPLIEEMVRLKPKIKFQKTDSVLEALLLEAELIKKHSPKFNVKGKDQRSWNHVVITREEYPKIIIVRERELPTLGIKFAAKFGPFTGGRELREGLKIIRKIFPYRDDKCTPLSGKPCFNYQIGLCPGTCVGKISKKEYSNILKNIRMIFEGKKKTLLKKLEGEMKGFAKEKKFEKAQGVKRQVIALKHIQDIAMIKSTHDAEKSEENFRIEAYDISHISGTNIVGVMTVLEGGEVKKSDYRKFKIRGQRGSDDTKALKEVLERRFKHLEWKFPNLVVVDGSTAQINTAENVLKNLNLNIKVVGVTKDERHKAKEIKGDYNKNLEKQILLANSESHRFAIQYHRSLRSI